MLACTPGASKNWFHICVARGDSKNDVLASWHRMRRECIGTGNRASNGSIEQRGSLGLCKRFGIWFAFDHAESNK
eukprot:262998-Amphidinium_carterae.1